MGKAISYESRKKIINRRKRGHSYTEIASNLNLSLSGIKKIWYRYQKEGEMALSTKYSNCGRPSPYGEDLREEIAELRDNEQGADYIRSKLLLRSPKRKTPCQRTLQRWWQKDQTNSSKGRVPKGEKSLES